jgi:hypothetical protein
MTALAAHRLVAVPGLAELQADPAILSRLPLDVLVDLRRQVRHLDIDLDAAITRQVVVGQPRQAQAEPDRLLSPKEAAALYSVSVRWLLEHADEIPGVRRLSKKVIRFSERTLRRYLNGVKA